MQKFDCLVRIDHQELYDEYFKLLRAGELSANKLYDLEPWLF